MIVIFMSMPDLVYVRLSCSKVRVLTVGTHNDTGLKTHIDTDTAYRYRQKVSVSVKVSVSAKA